MQQHIHGKELVAGKTYTVDHTVQSFTVVIRSMNNIGEQTIKDLIQQRYEVVSIKENDRTTYLF